jgi:FtsH-binding integral membrane protein
MDTEEFDGVTSNIESTDLISAVQYNFIMGIVLLWGFAVNWLTVRYIPVGVILSINIWLFFGGFLVSSIVGTLIFNFSKNPLVSFIGYNFVVVPFGLGMVVIVSAYSSSIVLEAMSIAGVVTVMMMVLGATFPRFFQGIAGALSIALLAVIVVESIEIFLLHIHHAIIDWIVAIIFCGYIGYDWGRASYLPKTMDNAVDSAAALYTDIINLFIRILSILGRKEE